MHAILVGLGSTLVVLTSLHLFDMYKGVTLTDPPPMITRIVTGIGCLRVGTIVQAEFRVRGLTRRRHYGSFPVLALPSEPDIIQR